MKRISGLVLFLAVAFASVWAQQQPSTDVPATKEDVEKLFATLHIRDQMRNIMEISAKQSMQMAHESLKKKVPDISQKDLDRMDAMVDRVLKDFDSDGMLDDMIPVYERHLTKTDVAAMTAFYESPTGQKMLKEQPEMMAEAMKAVQPRMEKLMSSVMDEAEKMAKEMATDSKAAGSESKTTK
jgi:hypothetical protein